MKKTIFAMTLCLGLAVHAADLTFSISSSDQSSIQQNAAVLIGGSYYNWGRAQNGFGYCYQWASNGQVLNGGAAQPDFYCEQVSRSFFNWGRGQNGFGYCYQFTGNGLLMNLGAAQANYSCEQRSPSYFSWGRGQDGFTRCYQYAPSGLPLNNGAPASNFYCQ